MKPFSSIEDQHGVDRPDYEAPSEDEGIVPEPEVPTQPRYAISALGMALVAVGAIGMGVSLFLPFVEVKGLFASVKENTLIQQDGWPLLVCALAAVATAYRNYSAGRRGWAPIVWGLLGLAWAISSAWPRAPERSTRSIRVPGNSTSRGKVKSLHQASAYTSQARPR